MAIWQNSWSLDMSRKIEGDPQTSLSVLEGVLSGTCSLNLELKGWKHSILSGQMVKTLWSSESSWGLAALAVW